MKLTLRQKNYRPFTVLFQTKNSHVHQLPEDTRLACNRIAEILDETIPTQRPEYFWDGESEALNALCQGLRERRTTAFYCGDVCLTLE